MQPLLVMSVGASICRAVVLLIFACIVLSIPCMAVDPTLQSTYTQWLPYPNYNGGDSSVLLHLLAPNEIALNGTNLLTFAEAKAACEALGASLYSGVLSGFTMNAAMYTFFNTKSSINNSVVAFVSQSAAKAFFWTDVGVAGYDPNLRLYHHSAVPLLPQTESKLDRNGTRPHPGAQSVISNTSCLAWADYPPTQLTPTDCSARLMAMCERSSTDVPRAQNRWFQPGITDASSNHMVGTSLPAYVGNIEAFVSLEMVLRASAATQCTQLDADLGGVPNELQQEFALRVVYPTLVSGHIIGATLPCVWVGDVTYSGMGGNLTASPAIMFASASSATYSVYGATTTKCATFCTRRLAPVTLTLGKLTPFPGDIVPITVTIPAPATLTVTLSFTATSETSGFVQFTTQTVSFSSSSKVVSKTIGVMVGISVSSGVVVTVNSIISAPYGVRIPYNHNGTWTNGVRSFTVQSLVTVSLAQTSVSLAQGDTKEVLATLSKPASGNLVIVPAPNDFVTFSPITFSTGDKATVVTLMGKGVTASTTITFYVLGVDGSYVTTTEALTMTVTVVAPLTFSWSQKPLYFYAKDSTTGGLVSAAVTIPQPVTMNISSNCPNVITFSAPSLTFTVGTETRSFEMVAGEVYYERVVCRISFSFLDGAVRAQLPDPIDVIIYRQKYLNLIRAPSGVSKTDQDMNLTYVFTVSEMPPSPTTTAATISLSTSAACSSRFTFAPASFTINPDDATTWVVVFNLTYTVTSGGSPSCPVELGLNQGFGKAFKPASEQPPLPAVLITGGNADILHLSPLSHPDYFAYRGVAVNFLVWWRTNQGAPAKVRFTVNNSATATWNISATVQGEISYAIISFSAESVGWTGSYLLKADGLDSGSNVDRTPSTVEVSIRPRIAPVVSFVRQGFSDRLATIPTSLDAGETIEVQFAPQAVLMPNAFHRLTLSNGYSTSYISLRGDTPTALLTRVVTIPQQSVVITVATDSGTLNNQPYISYSTSATVSQKANIVWLGNYTPYDQAPINGRQCVVMYYQASATTNTMTFTFETSKASPVDNITLSPTYVTYQPSSNVNRYTEVCATVNSATNGWFAIKAYVSAVSGSTTFAKETATVTFTTNPLVIGRVVPVNGTISNSPRYRIMGANASVPVAVRVEILGNTTGMGNVTVRIVDQAFGNYTNFTFDPLSPNSDREFSVPVSSDSGSVRSVLFPLVGNPFLALRMNASVGYVSTSYGCQLVPTGGHKIWRFGGDVWEGNPVINLHSTFDPLWGQIFPNATDSAVYNTTLYYGAPSPTHLNPALQLTAPVTVTTGFVAGCTNANSACYNSGLSVPGYYRLAGQVTPFFTVTPTQNAAAAVGYKSTSCTATNDLRWVDALRVGPLGLPTFMVGGAENAVTVRVGVPPLSMLIGSLYPGISFNATISFSGENTTVVSASPTVIGMSSKVLDGSSNLVDVTIRGASKPGAKVFLHVTFSPTTPYFAAYTHPVPIVIDEQFYLNVTEYAPTYLTLYGNADCVDFTLTLEKPLEVNTSATISVALGSSILEVEGGSSFNVTNVSTSFHLRVQIPAASATLPSDTAANVSFRVTVLGERAAWIIPPPTKYIMVFDKLACTLTAATSAMYVGASNYQNVTVTIEAPPKVGRTLVLNLQCYNATSMTPLSNSVCVVSPSAVNFTSSSPLSVNCSVTVLAAGSIQVRLADIQNSSTAVEFAPVQRTISISVSALSSIVMSYSPSYMYVTSGRTVTVSFSCPQCNNQYGYVTISTNNSLSSFSPSTKGTNWVGKWMLSIGTDTATFTANSVASPIPTSLVTHVHDQVVSMSPTVDPVQFDFIVVPVSTISVVCANTNVYRGVQGYYFVNISLPSGWNLNPADPNATILGQFSYTSPNPYPMRFNGSSSGSSYITQGSRSLLLEVSTTSTQSSSSLSLNFNPAGISFEYALPTVSCPFAIFSLIPPSFSLSGDWYVGQTLQLVLLVPVFNANHCLNGTSIIVTATNPSMTGGISMPPAVTTGQTQVNATLSSIVLTAGSFSLSATTSGQCYVIDRSSAVSLNYTVHVAERTYLRLLPSFAFIGDSVPLTMTLKTFAPFRPRENVTVTLKWNASASCIRMCSSAGNCGDSGTLSFYVPHNNDLPIDTSLPLTLTAVSAQTTPVTFTIAVPFPHNLTFNQLAFGNSSTIEIPAMQNIVITSTVAGVQRTLRGTNTTVERVFYNEYFNVTLARPSGANRYGVKLDISLSTDSHYIKLLGRVGSLDSATNPSVTFQLKVLPAGERIDVPIQFNLTQSGNLYNAPMNRTIHVVAPTSVEIVGGYPARLVCGAANSQNVELLPAAAPVRDNVTLIFAFAGQLVVLENATWYVTKNNVTSLRVPVEIPCVGSGVLPKNIYVNISFDSPEFMPSQAAFVTQVTPLGRFQFSSVVPNLFRQQTMLIELTMTYAPLQFPLSVSVFIANKTPGEIKYVDAESLSGALSWPIGLASPPRADIELFGFEAMAEGESRTLVVETGGNPEYDIEFYNLECSSTCNITVVPKAEVKPSMSALVVFLGKNKTFDVTVDKCAKGSNVTVALEPFEFENALQISTADNTVPCPTGGGEKVTYTVVGFDTGGTGDPTPRPTQVLVTLSASLLGARNFAPSQSLDMTIEIRRPAQVVLSISGQFIFFGRSAYITVRLPRLPSEGQLTVTVLPSDNNLTFSPSTVATWDQSSSSSATPTTAELTRTFAISTLDVTGQTKIKVQLSGLAVDEFYIASLGNVDFTFDLNRTKPWKVTVGLSQIYPEYFIGIPYLFKIQIEEPVGLTTNVTISLNLTNSQGRVVSTAKAFFTGSTIMLVGNMTAVEIGSHTVSASVSGSESYDLNVDVVQRTLVFRNLLQLVLSETSVERYVSQAVLLTVTSPPLLAPGYTVTLDISWVGAAGSGSGVVLPVPSPRSYSYSASQVGVSPQFTLTAVGRLPTVGRLKVGITASREFNTAPLYVDMVVKSLIHLVAPSDVNLVGLVNAPITFSVSMSNLPPANTTYFISCGPQSSSGKVPSMTVTPQRQAIMPNSQTTIVTFTVTPNEVVTALVTVNATATGVSSHSLDTLQEVTFVLTVQALLAPIVTANSIILKPDRRYFATITSTTPASAGGAVTTATVPSTTLAPESDGSAAAIFVEDRNAVVVNVTMPTLFRFSKPSYIRVSVASADTTILTTKLLSPASATGIVELGDTTVYPFYSAFQVTGVTTSPSTIRSSFILITVESDTHEYEAVLPFRFNVYPLHGFAVSNNIEYLYAGEANKRTFQISPTSAPQVRSDGTVERLRIQLSCSCDSAVISPSILTWITMSSVDVTVWVRDASSTACIISGQQTEALGISSRFELSPISVRFNVRAQPQVSLTVVVDDVSVTEVPSKVVREKGIVFRITSTVAWGTNVDVSLINDSYIPSGFDLSTSALVRGGRNLKVMSTLPLSTYRSITDTASDQASGKMGTGFWRSVASVMRWQVDSHGLLTKDELNGVVSRGFGAMDNATNATVALRWSVSLQRLALDVVISPLPDYVSYVDEPIMILAEAAAFTEGVIPVSGKDRVTFTITGDTKPEQTYERSQAAGDIVFASASVCGALVFHGAVEGGRLMAVVSFSKCPSESWKTSQTNMGIFLNPLKDVFPFMVLASEEDYGYYAGAIVNNMLLIVIFGAVHLGVAYLAFKSKMLGSENVTFEEVKSVLGFPSLLWFPLLLVYVPTTILSCRLLLYSPNAGIKALASFSAVLCMVAVPIAAFRTVSTSYVLEYVPPTRPNVVRWLLEMGSYRHPTDPYWLGKYGGPIRHLRGEVRWFFVLEIVSMVAVSAVLSASPTTNSSCTLRNIAACILFFAVFIAFVLLQPMSAKIDNIFFGLLALVQAVIMALTTASADQAENSSQLDDTVTTMLIAVAACLLVRGVLGWCVVLWGWAKACFGYHVETARRYGEEFERSQNKGNKAALLVVPTDESPLAMRRRKLAEAEEEEEMMEQQANKGLTEARRMVVANAALSSSVGLGDGSTAIVRRGFHKAFDPAIAALDRYVPPAPATHRSYQVRQSRTTRRSAATNGDSTEGDSALYFAGYNDNGGQEDYDALAQRDLFNGGGGGAQYYDDDEYYSPPYVPSYENNDDFTSWEQSQML